ncbi:MAG TPA: PIG-L family deacetylase [Chitinophagaceae bacterium]|nr:PIG-L family deacetylase [Chitinophagaceae bacterium]
MKKVCLLAFSIFAFHFSLVFAQAPAIHTSADIYMQLKKLNVLGSVLYIAAHPDDENTRLLAYFSKEKQYRTGYLSLTRGDGGQNLIGDEQGIELGLIRTQELLAARRIDGAEQFFSRAYDFGFSKNAAEALRIWGHDKILSDVIRVIKKFKPDIIITRFPGDARAGHGHHWASALLANEAFRLAGDSVAFNRLRDSVLAGTGVHQGQDVEKDSAGLVFLTGMPWQAKRILWNTFNFGNTNTTSPDQFKMEVGDYDPLLGQGFGEIAAESRSQHKSQGFGIPRQRGQATEFFATTGGEPPVNDIMDGVNTTWSRVQGGAAVEAMVNDIVEHYDFEHPEKSIDALVVLYKTISALPDGYWRNRKLDEVQNLIVECSGLFMEATTNSEYAVEGDSMRVSFFINEGNKADIHLDNVKFDGFDSSININIPYNQNIGFNKYFPVPVNRNATQPYWLVKPLDNGGSFDVTDPSLIGNAQNNPPYMAVFNLTVNGLHLIVTRPLQAKYTDAVKGEQYQPVVVIPPVIVSVSPSIALINIRPGNAYTANPVMQVKYKTNFSENQVPVTIKISEGASSVFTKDTVINAEAGKEFEMDVPIKKVYVKNIGTDLLGTEIYVTRNGHRYVYSHYLRSIEYDHIPHIHYFYRDNVKVLDDEIKTVGHSIGYVVGAGDKVPPALVQMGYNVKILNAADITDENLKQFDAIITGVRAYDVDAFLNEKYDVLMRYVKNGGNLIVQYNRSNQISNGQIKVGPYPFAISNIRVTNENAEVHILQPNSGVLNYPNKITDADFKNWIQERSIYQANTQDAHFEEPIGMHDPNEKESNGSLIIAKYGKGNFVYTGIVFFRELPAGVSGAYRLMANLIALKKNQ